MGRATTTGRDRVAQALWATLAREGIAGVSVRAVAAEAGVSAGTVQYYFRTRAQMLQYAMELIAQRVEQRLRAMPRSGPARQWTREILLQMLPLDADRHHEFSIWLAFGAHAHTDPALAGLKHRTTDRQRDLYRRLVRARRAAADGDPHPLPDGSPDARAGQADRTQPAGGTAHPGDEADAAILHAVIDGLSLQLADLPAPEAATRGPALLDHHLRGLDARWRD